MSYQPFNYNIIQDANTLYKFGVNHPYTLEDISKIDELTVAFFGSYSNPKVYESFEKLSQVKDDIKWNYLIYNQK